MHTPTARTGARAHRYTLLVALLIAAAWVYLVRNDLVSIVDGVVQVARSAIFVAVTGVAAASAIYLAVHPDKIRTAVKSTYTSVADTFREIYRDIRGT